MSKLNPSLKPTPKVVDERLAGGSGSLLQDSQTLLYLGELY